MCGGIWAFDYQGRYRECCRESGHPGPHTSVGYPYHYSWIGIGREATPVSPLKEASKMQFDEKGARRLYAIDLDGVLTNGEPFWEVEPTPNVEAIAAVREIYKGGNIVIVWTARQWTHAQETVAWLFKHSVPFHGLYMAKGGADFYVDDKMTVLRKPGQVILPESE